MKITKFEYYHKDISQLKKDIVVRFIFSILFLATFIWQGTLLVLEYMHGNFSILKGIISASVLVSALMVSVVTMFFAFKDLQIIAAIKMKGKCVSSVNVLFNIEKTGFLKLYSILVQILTLGTSLLLIACITYSILEITVLSTISFYMPLLILICLSGFTSIYHVKDEIRTQKNVQKQMPLY